MINDFVGGARHYGGLGVYNFFGGFKTAFWDVGPVRAGYKVCSLVGLEKMCKALIGDLKLLSFLPAVGTVFKDAIKAIEDQKDLYYGFMWINALGRFVQIDPRDNERVVFGLPRDEQGYLKIPLFLYSIGDFCEFGRYLQKKEVCSFPRCSALANKLGSFEIYGIKPFTYRPLDKICERPKDFFLFIGSLYDLGESAWKFFFPAGNSDAARRRYREKLFSSEQIFKTIGNIGKLYLVWKGKTDYNKLSFAVAIFVSQNASLLAFLIK